MRPNFNCRQSGELSADRTAQKSVFVEDAYFRHVPWIDSQGYGLADVCGKRCRDVAEILEVNAVNSHLARLGHLNQQQVELLQRIRHSGQKPVRFPAFNRWRLGLCVVAAMVDV